MPLLLAGFSVLVIGMILATFHISRTDDWEIDRPMRHFK